MRRSADQEGIPQPSTTACCPPATAGVRQACLLPRRFTLIELLVALAILALVLAVAVPRVGRLPARLRAERGVSAIQTAMSEAALTARATGHTVRLVLTLEGEHSSFTMKRGASDSTTEDILGHFSLPEPDADGQVAEGPQPLQEESSEFMPDQREFELPDDLTWGSEFTGELDVPIDEEIAFVFHPGGEAGGPELPFTVGKRSYVLSVERLTGRPVISEVSR